jgi:hypothetical protein
MQSGSMEFSEICTYSSTVLFDDTLEAFLDDLLGNLDPVDCILIVDFCSDWLPVCTKTCHF